LPFVSPWPFTTHAAFASSEMDILLKKLQEKGILTATEAADIAKETKAAAAQAQAAAPTQGGEQKKAEAVPAKSAELPEWIKNTKLKGDLRLRYEAADREEDSRGTKGRGRFRLRAGVDTTITDTISAGFGLATGTGDERSANQTFSNIFTRKSIWADYAYAKWTPAKWFSATGGKFTNPIWQPSDMLISTDVNPEGGALQFTTQAAPNIGLSFTGGVFILDDRNTTLATTTNPSRPDALLYAFQPGIKVNFTKDMFFRFAPVYYAFGNIKGEAVLGSAAQAGTGTPSAVSVNRVISATNGRYRYDYSVINWGGEFGWNKPFGMSSIPYLGIMGGYAHNPDPSQDNTAYLAGMMVGYTDVKKFGDWSVEYTFRRLERDAWLDLLPDTSFYSGNTNVMGHRVKVLFGLAKNTTLGFNFYDTWKVRSFANNFSLTPASTRKFSAEEYLFQGDLIVKW
jgi:hypothetical protein